jgi:hypothetical protein
MRAHAAVDVVDVDVHSRVSREPLSAHVVARMLRPRAQAAGLDGNRITAHSLRAGHATASNLAGVPLTRIAAQPSTVTSPSWPTGISGRSKRSRRRGAGISGL